MMLSAASSENAIVVVDDNPAILNLVASAIHCVASVPVRCFESPIAALRDFAEHPGECRMVISDFDMPGMNGADMLSQIAGNLPELPMILFSGSTKEEIVESRLPSHCRFLAKIGGFLSLLDAIEGIVGAGE